MSAKEWVLVLDSGLSARRLFFERLQGETNVESSSALGCDEVKRSTIDLDCLLAPVEDVASASSSFRLPFAFDWLLLGWA